MATFNYEGVANLYPKARAESDVHDDLRERLCALPIFASLDEDAQHALVAEIRPRSVRPAEVVLDQDGQPAGVFLVLSGRLKVSVVSPTGHEIVLSVIGEGEVFGETSALSEEPHAAAVTALSPCELGVVSADRFRRFLDAHPRAALPLLRVVAERLRSLTVRSEAMGSTLPARLAKILLLLASRFGVSAHGRTRLDLEISQKTLGDFAGASRESINKQLRAWEGRGLLSREDGEIVIVNMSELRAISDERPTARESS